MPELLVNCNGVPKSTTRAWLQKYRRDGQVRRRTGTGLRRVSRPAQDAALVAEAQKNPFVSARDLPGPKITLISRLKEACLRARHAAVKEHLNDEYKLYRLAFAENNVDSKWYTVIFSDKCIFSSASDGPVLV